MLSARMNIARPVVARQTGVARSAGRVAAVSAVAREAAWMPGTEAPAHLDGSLPADFGECAR